MRKFSYWLCFALIAISSISTQTALFLSLADVKIPAVALLIFFQLLGSLIPPMFTLPFHLPITILLNLVMFLLVLRRLWRLIKKHEGVPLSFAGIPKVLGYIGALSFSLSLVTLFLAILLNAGSGVPAGLLLIPAVFCVPWAFFLTEILSFRRTGVT